MLDVNGAARPRSCRARGDELSEALCQQNEPAAGLQDGDACQEVMAQGQERGASGRTKPMLRVGSIRGLHSQPPERLPKGQIFLVRVPHPHPRGSSDQRTEHRQACQAKRPNWWGSFIPYLPQTHPGRSPIDSLFGSSHPETWSCSGSGCQCKARTGRRHWTGCGSSASLGWTSSSG